MKISFIPKTILGKWSVGLIVIFFLLLTTLRLLVALGQRGGATFFSNLTLALPGLLAGIASVGAFFTGLIGIIKSQERAVLVFLATVIGLFVLLFLLGEFLSPH